MAKFNHRLDVRLSDRDNNILQDVARQLGTTKAWVIRHALQNWFSRKGLYHEGN